MIHYQHATRPVKGDVRIGKMKNFFIGISILLACAPTVVAKPATDGMPRSPNIIFILADDVGIGDIKCFYPPSKVTTPNIDRLASEGMKFNQAYAPGATCSPSRYALISGSYPCRGPLRSTTASSGSPLTIGVDALTLPKFLQKQGYKTAHIGKWHLGYSEKGVTNWAGELKPGANELGFDYHFALPSNHNDGFKTYVENHRLLWLKEGIANLSKKPTIDQLTQVRYDDLGDTTLTAKGIEFMEDNRDQPFFLYLALTATHTHITPHKQFRGTSEIGQLGDYINELDHHVGEIMEALETLGLEDNTILFFSSDNGAALKDHSSAGKNLTLKDPSQGVGKKAKTAKIDAYKKFGHRANGKLNKGKGSNFEGGHRVPYVVRWPNKISASSESDQIITLTDTLATAAGFLGKTLPDSAGLDSFDMSPVMLGKALDTPRNEAILQTSKGALAFRQGDWKIRFAQPTVWQGDQPKLPNRYELFNLARDPGEKKDLSEQHPEQVKAMRSRLLSLLNEGRSR
jgi:arylsulfatase A